MVWYTGQFYALFFLTITLKLDYVSAYTLIGIPFFLAGVITLVNRPYMRPLYYSHKGHMLILIGFAMMAVGSLILKKIVSFRG